MFAALRRFRPLCVLLLALSPGGLGTALPVLHPCPVDAPSMVHHAAAQGGGQDGHAASGAQMEHAAHAAAHAAAPATPASDHSQGHQSCHCPGACCPSAPVVAPTTYALSVLRLGHVARPQAPPDGPALPAGRAARLLPPSTAPPALA
ncbi:MAG TPA: hypothetical protein VFS40_09005 [Gemmatimonadales bacterium]|nr:hypothetical protein [Gemmatimonadales bacterium]